MYTYETRHEEEEISIVESIVSWLEFLGNTSCDKCSLYVDGIDVCFVGPSERYDIKLIN